MVLWFFGAATRLDLVGCDSGCRVKSICTRTRMRSVYCCHLSKTKTNNLCVVVFENSGFIIAIWVTGFQSACWVLKTRSERMKCGNVSQH